MERQITHQYRDPLDLIWLHVAESCGITVVRDPEVFASWDGARVLRIGTPATLDPDDSLAQMILHELCHALVAGPDGFSQPDWGLDYDDPQHMVFEHAALRLQAALADEFGLREFFASTTDFRQYYDRIPADALAKRPNDPGPDNPAIHLARSAIPRLGERGWAKPIRHGLTATQQIASIIFDSVPKHSLWKTVAISQ